MEIETTLRGITDFISSQTTQDAFKKLIENVVYKTIMNGLKILHQNKFSFNIILLQHFKYADTFILAITGDRNENF